MFIGIAIAVPNAFAATATTEVSLTVAKNTATSDSGGGWRYLLPPATYIPPDPITLQYNAEFNPEFNDVTSDIVSRGEESPSVHPSASGETPASVAVSLPTTHQTESPQETTHMGILRTLGASLHFNPAFVEYGKSMQSACVSLLDQGMPTLLILRLLILVFFLLLFILILLVHQTITVRNPWHVFNVFVLLCILSYGGIVVLEYVGAASMTVSFEVTSGSLSLSCASTASLGSIALTGDTGAYDSGRRVRCSVSTSNANGYSLQWKSQPISGRTATGSLQSQNGDTISPYTPSSAATPEAWSVASSTSEWGGRLSSLSTTVNEVLWGTDGSSEKWLNVSTGGTLIANRASTTGGTPDNEDIGLRAEIGSTKSQPIGTYQANIVFTATTN